MNIFKFLTKSGRQEIARGLLDEYLTADALAEAGAKGVTNILASACKNVTDDKMASVCDTCAAVGNLSGRIATACKDKVITTAEANDIIAGTREVIGTGISAETLEAIKAKVLSYVP